MAASEYYYGTAATQPPNGSHPYPPQPQPQHQFQHQQQYQQPPPPYSPHQQPQLYGNGPSKSTYPGYPGYPPQPPSQPEQTYPPYPSNGRPGTLVAHPEPPSTRPQNYPPPPRPQNGYLGAPLQHHRSHSQPPRVQRVRFEDELYDSVSSDDRSYPSDSDHSSRRRHRRRKHRTSHTHDRSASRSASPDRDRSHSHSHSHSHSRHHESRTQRKEHKDRSTFLGAGVGGLIGDAIVPGLGTAAGLLLGGYGGRKAARKRSHSAGVADREYYPHRGRAQGESGWDEESATFRKGHAVR